MYIKNIDTQKEELIIFYNNLYISRFTNNFVAIQQARVSEGQRLEQKNRIKLATEPTFTLNITKEN